MRKFKRTISFILAGMLALTAFSGCSTGSGTSTGKTSATAKLDTSKAVTLKMYLLGTAPTDENKVLSAFNENAKKDLNCTLDVSYIGWGDYATKYPLILSSGEQVDLMYTATWLNYYQQAQKGAFMALDDLLPKYAPKSYAEESKQGLEQAKVDGHIYALPSNAPTYNAYGPIVNGKLMKKYGMTTISNMDDYTKYLDNVVKNDSTLDPTGFVGTSGGEIDDLYYMTKNLYPLTGSCGSLYWTDLSDSTHKVFSIDEWSGFKDYLKLANEWYKKGYWPKSVLSNQDSSLYNEGKAASQIHNIDTWVGNCISNPDNDSEWFNIVPKVHTLSMMQDAMVVPASAQNPERALMLLEKLRTDQSYYDLLTYGIKGTSYTTTSSNQLKVTDANKYYAEPGTWGFRESKWKMPLSGTPSDYKTKLQTLTSSADNSFKWTSFYMDTDSIKNEYSACTNAQTTYYYPLVLGYTNQTTEFVNLQKQLKSAGNDKVIKELQSQVDKFWAGQK